MLVVITPTGGRPAQFSHLCDYLLRQRYVRDLRWIVVDDVSPATVYRSEIETRLPRNWELILLRPNSVWQPGDNTQCRNMSLALGHVEKFDKVVVMEDDDWYAPTFLYTVESWLDTHDVVGEGQARYYNVPMQSYRQLINMNHASLCSTGLKGNAINVLRNIVERNEKWIDIALWAEADGGMVYQQNGLVVGIKGLPGRSGIGMGHRTLDGVRDIDGTVLRQWIGDDVRRYLPIVH